MEIGIAIVVVYAVAVIVLVKGFDRPRKNRQRLTGRGGDFDMT